VTGAEGTVHGALGNELERITSGAVIQSSERCWASSQFKGARHRYVIGFEERQPLPDLADLDEREFELSGHIVADIALVGRSWRKTGCHVTIEALTVMDG